MKTARLFSALYIRCAAMLVMLVCALWCAAGAQASSAAEFAVVYNTDYLNLRADATTNSTRLGSYDQGTWVRVCGEKGNWYYVTCPDGKTGYMSKNFLTYGPTQAENVGIVSNPKATSYLNLRRSPSYTAEVLGIFYNGVPFRIHSYQDGWYKVTVDGQQGYFRQEFITRKYMVYGSRVATIQTPNNTALNMRQGPGKGYDVIRQYRGGQYVMVLAKGMDWWKVSVDGYIGFMSDDFLTEGIRHQGGESTGGKGYGLVTNPRSTQVLNLRQQPDTASIVLDSYRNGTRVTILAQGSEWCQVTVDKTGETGYMMTKYLTLHNLPSRPTRTTTHPQGSFVNLRRWSSMNAAVLARVPDGRSVEILIPGADWCKVRYNGTTGYMVSYFLE